MKTQRLHKYYLIGEVAKLFGVHVDTVRRWEKQGIVVSHRDPQSKFRLFPKENIHLLCEHMGREIHDTTS